MSVRGRDDLLTSLNALQEAGMPMPASNEMTAEEEMEMNATHECVLAAIESLSPDYRAVYMMRKIEAWSAIETAEQLELSVPAVQSRLRRARTMVREALDKALGFP